jgi:hypothetical protein
MGKMIRCEMFALRTPIIALLLLVVFATGGCTWWDNNVVKKVKNVTSRRLTVSTDPPGADVFVNDVFQGKSPVTLNYKYGIKDMWNGFVIVVQKEGYLPVRREASYKTESAFFRLIKKRGRAVRKNR